jgi:cholesterol oxidase
VLAAGTLGTTYLMLSNRSAFPQVSKQLGTRFCGNGDLLTFALNCSDNSSGTPKPRVIEASYGPVITGMISKLEGRGFLIQDAGYPNFVNWMLQFTDVWGMLKRFIAFGVHRIGQNISGLIDTDVSEEIARLFGKAEFSAGLLPLLGMGRDVPDGKMHLNGYGKLAVDWNKRSSEAFFAALRQQMKEIGTALGSEPFLDNPLWWLSRLITVHPLGGCPMGADDREGVVDSYGRVFNYPGLYIVDGSVMPGPTGVNPAFTIAACADRFADKLLEEFK